MEHLHVDFYVKALALALNNGHLLAISERINNLFALTARTGTGSVAAKLAAEQGDWKYINTHKLCPECSTSMMKLLAEGVEIDICARCRGVWFDKSELLHFTQEVDDTPDLEYKTRYSNYQCPLCNQYLVTCQFKIPFSLLVEVCRQQHGVYFEAGELSRAIDIIEKMGKPIYQ